MTMLVLFSQSAVYFVRIVRCQTCIVFISPGFSIVLSEPSFPRSVLYSQLRSSGSFFFPNESVVITDHPETTSVAPFNTMSVS